MKKLIKIILIIIVIVLILAICADIADKKTCGILTHKAPAVMYYCNYTMRIAQATCQVSQPDKSIQINNVISLLPHSTTEMYAQIPLMYKNIIVIHHDDSNFDDWTPLYIIANYHVKKKQWPGIGYHFYIDHAGNIYQTQELKTISNHCEKHNSNSIGICFQGNFNKQHPTDFQYSSGTKLISHLKTKLNIINVFGHRDLNETDCPGTNFNINLLKQN